MVATATKKTKTDAAGNVLAKFHADAEALFEASEQILFAAVDEGREHFPPNEVAILRAAGYKDTDNMFGLRGIVGRAIRVRDAMKKAGSNGRSGR
jgi:hypothetical protein